MYLPYTYKKALADRILGMNGSRLIRLIPALLESANRNETGHVSIEQYNQEINQAMEDVRNGNYISHEDVKKKIASRRAEIVGH